MIKPFIRKSSKTILTTPIFTLREDLATHPRTGQDGRYVVLESPDWVNVVALTEDGDYILVSQWRHGLRCVGFELPAGIIDEGEDPLVAGARELREETGYEAKTLRIIGSVAANPAYQDNTCHTLLAEGCRKVHDIDLDDGEDIEVHITSPEDLEKMIRDGRMRNAMGICALFWHRNGV